MARAAGPSLPILPTTVERFWAKVDRTGGPHACWPWTGALDPSGYGAFKIDGKKYNSHRVAFAIEHGELPRDGMALHACDNRACCNPACLRSGNSADNHADASNRHRWAPYRGRANTWAKFTDDLVKELRADLEMGRVSIRAAARRHGVSHSTIRRIATRQTWAHVE